MNKTLIGQLIKTIALLTGLGGIALFFEGCSSHSASNDIVLGIATLFSSVLIFGYSYIVDAAYWYLKKNAF